MAVRSSENGFIVKTAHLLKCNVTKPGLVTYDMYLQGFSEDAKTVGVNGKTCLVEKSFWIFVVFALILILYSLLVPPFLYATEEYERKSILLLLAPVGVEYRWTSSKLESIVKTRMRGTSRFDFHALSGTLHADFQIRTRKDCSETIEELNSISSLIKQVEREGNEAYEKSIGSKEKMKQLDITSRRKAALLSQFKVKETELHQQISVLMNEMIAPELFRILSDPEVQKLRASDYADEVDRESFIVKKAKQLGISKADLERFMNTAYVCAIAPTVTTKVETEEGVLHIISGVILWYQLVVSEDRYYMRIVKTIKADDFWDLFDRFDLETRGLDAFSLKTQVIEAKGSKIGFALGKREGLYTGQKFLLYEQQEFDKRKCGFFYVYKVGDNTSSKNELYFCTFCGCCEFCC